MAYGNDQGLNILQELESAKKERQDMKRMMASLQATLQANLQANQKEIRPVYSDPKS